MFKWKKISFILIQQRLYSKIKSWYKLSKPINKLNIITLAAVKEIKINNFNDNNLLLEQILIKADKLIEERKFNAAYEYLYQFKNYGHEIYWRLSKILYKISCNENISKIEKLKLIDEGLYHINFALLSTNNNSNLFKWKAILFQAKSENIHIKYKVQTFEAIKIYLLKAHKLNPNDFSILYMLGHWCFQVASLTWFQRKIALLLYSYNPPESSYEEAYYYFSKAEEIKPGQSIINVYMLGRVTYCLKQYYRAQYYLKLATNLPALFEKERKIQVSAEMLVKKLKKFDVTQAIIINN